MLLSLYGPTLFRCGPSSMPGLRCVIESKLTFEVVLFCLFFFYLSGYFFNGLFVLTGRDSDDKGTLREERGSKERRKDV